MEQAKSNIKNHKRETTTILSFVEKPLLNFLAARLPNYFTPDILTGIGLIGSFITALGYYLSSYTSYYLWLASLGLIVNWFGDSLDGTVARYRHIEKPKYGFFIDHTLDSLSMVAVGIGVGLSSYARFDLVLLALVAYQLMSILVYVRTFVNGVFKISYYGFGPTEVRVFIILLNTLMFYFGAYEVSYGNQVYTIIDLGAIFLSIILFLMFVLSVVLDGKKLKQEELRVIHHNN